MIRLNKYLANLGIASRRKVDVMIEEGRILLNGSRAKLGATVDPQVDKIVVDGKSLETKGGLEYYAVYKPIGYVSSASDPHNEKTVTSLVKSSTRLYPVGRLDQDSEGLILLTNDGDLTFRMTHPKYHIPKTYEVVLEGKWNDQKLNKLQKGVKLKDGVTAKTEVKVLNLRPRRTLIHITLYEGKNRQIRRMAGILKLEVTSLKRLAIGPIKLADLKPGQSRPLTPEEVSSLSS